MMRIYITPTAKVVRISNMAILAGSLDIKDKDTDEMLSKPGMFYELGEEDEE